MHTFIEKHQKLITSVFALLGVFLLVASLGKLKENRFIGSGLPASNMITVSGQGKVERSPDTAKFTFTISDTQKEMKVAQDTVSKKIDTATKALTSLGIDAKYIKTDSYSSYPQYDYPTIECFRTPCPGSTPVLRGYQVSQIVTVQVKDLELVEKVAGALGTAGVIDLQGPNFGFEDDKAVAREARDMAIEDAKSEAEKLAKSLGVKLVRIVSFSENAGGYPVPMYARMDAMKSEGATSTPAIPVGQNTVQSNVTIVYEIR